MKTLGETLESYFKAAFPGVAIQTTDERRAVFAITEAAVKAKRQVFTWSTTEGLVKRRAMLALDKSIVEPVEDTEALTALCVQKHEKHSVYIVRDPHTWPLEGDPVMLRTFRDFIANAPSAGSTVVIVANGFRPHPCLANLVTMVDHELPSEEDLRRLVVQNAARQKFQDFEPTQELIRALGGLTITEADNALALSWVETTTYVPEVVYREKIRAVMRTGMIEIIEPDPRGLDAIGGLDILKTWVRRRANLSTLAAREYGVREPKGMLLVGPPGTGKSLAAQAVGTIMAIPTLKVDISSLLDSLVGMSERNTRACIAMIDAMAPCVLWLDEVDKGFAGAQSASGDSGVMRRVFELWLKWMERRKRAGVFVVATANGITDIPDEFLRKGRFDEMFAVDLPQARDRKEIFAIHLKKRGRIPEDYDIDVLAHATHDFIPAEIEAVVEEALVNAFDAGPVPLTTDHLIEAARGIVPLAKTSPAKMNIIRAWAAQNAKPASSKEVVASTPVDEPEARVLMNESAGDGGN